MVYMYFHNRKMRWTRPNKTRLYHRRKSPSFQVLGHLDMGMGANRWGLLVRVVQMLHLFQRSGAFTFEGKKDKEGPSSTNVDP